MVSRTTYYDHAKYRQQPRMDYNTFAAVHGVSTPSSSSTRLPTEADLGTSHASGSSHKRPRLQSVEEDDSGGAECGGGGYNGREGSRYSGYQVGNGGRGRDNSIGMAGYGVGGQESCGGGNCSGDDGGPPDPSLDGPREDGNDGGAGLDNGGQVHWFIKLYFKNYSLLLGIL